MPYSTFKSIGEVSQKFDIEVRSRKFIETKSIHILEYPFNSIRDNLTEDAYFINEYAICEAIVRPILNVIAENYENLIIWSHPSFNVDKEKNLVGEPDYLVAPKTKHGVMSIPPLCVMEAKKENWDEGWAQTLAEMYAASTQGAKICFGVVTTGKAWEFGQLKDNLFTKDPNQLSATMDLQSLFNVLNWLFDRANSNLFKKELPISDF